MSEGKGLQAGRKRSRAGGRHLQSSFLATIASSSPEDTARTERSAACLQGWAPSQEEGAPSTFRVGGLLMMREV